MRSGPPHAFSWRVAATLSLLASLLVASCEKGRQLGGDPDAGGTGGSGSGAAGHGSVGTGGSGGASPGVGGSAGHIGGTGGSAGVGGTSGGAGGRVGGGDASSDLPLDRGPCVCPAIFQPVCGVDGRTYSNACAAGCAGVAVAHTGACADAGVDGAGCSVAAGCCARDSDCTGTQECAGNAACSGTGGEAAGVCKTRPAQTSGQCWTDADCPGPGAVCTGASVCPCGFDCLVADHLGTCAA